MKKNMKTIMIFIVVVAALLTIWALFSAFAGPRNHRDTAFVDINSVDVVYRNFIDYSFEEPLKFDITNLKAGKVSVRVFANADFSVGNHIKVKNENGIYKIYLTGFDYTGYNEVSRQTNLQSFLPTTNVKDKNLDAFNRVIKERVDDYIRYTYMVKNEGTIKSGLAKELKTKLAQMGIDSPFVIEWN